MGRREVSPGIASLVAALGKGDSVRTVLDPACGYGTILVETAKALRQGARRSSRSAAATATADVTLWGQETDIFGWALTKFRLFAHGFADQKVEFGDALRTPRNVDGGTEELLKADQVVCAPPFGARVHDSAKNDPWGRFDDSTPARNASESALLQHAVACLEPKSGKALVVLPRGFLSRTSDRELRRSLLSRDLLEAVFTMSEKKAVSQPALVVLNCAKPDSRRGEILFADLNESLGSTQGGRDSHVAETIKSVRDAYDAWKPPVGKYAALVKTELLLDQDGFFDPTLNQEVEPVGPLLSPAETLVHIKELEGELRECDDALDDAFAAFTTDPKNES
jgi:type I restriction enzyme M protein